MNILQSAISRVIRKGQRELKKRERMKRLSELGLCYVEPNFLYHNSFKVDGVVIDAGCSYEADLSQYMIKEHQARAFGVDPTLKHRPALERLEERLVGRFTHLPLAISAQDGALTFHESAQNESGSLLDSHINVKNDEILTYEVESVTLSSLLSRMEVTEVELLKLDLEGAEYELLASVNAEMLAPFKQIFVEFHHHATALYSEADTARLVKHIESCDFQSYSLDDHNYIFYRAL